MKLNVIPHLSTEPTPLLKLESHIYSQLRHKHSSSTTSYNKGVVSNIIYNEKSHCVASFKDYLILDDSSEFLKRFYTRSESDKRLPKFYEYYETYSKIFPNYTSILEGKFIYRNIQKKQKMIDLQEQMEVDLNLKSRRDKTDRSDEVFSTDVYDSIINDRNNEDLEEIFNLNAKEEEFFERLKEMIGDIDKNDTPVAGVNHNRSSSISNININTNSQITSNNNINNIPMQLTSNLFSTKHKLLISSLLGRNKYITTRNNLSNTNESNNKIVFSNNLNSCTSNSSSKYIISPNIPLTDRVTSRNNNTHTNHIQEATSIHSANKSKLLPDYPKTIVISNNPFIQRSKYKEEIPIPLTQRDPCRNKSNDINHNDSRKGKRHQMTIKTPSKRTNNYIYIINQNPKYTTHVTYFNNNNHAEGSSSNSIGNKSKPQSKAPAAANSAQAFKISSKRTGTTNANVYFVNRGMSKTRNSKQVLQNNMILRTTRESQYKDINMLRASSQPSIQMSQADNFYAKKFQSKRNIQIRDSSKNQTNSLSHNQQGSTGEIITQRSEKVNNQGSNANNVVNRLIEQKPMMKGIQIKNFSKVFTLNFSQATSDRLSNNKHKYEY